jgi:hypothetical protein
MWLRPKFVSNLFRINILHITPYSSKIWREFLPKLLISKDRILRGFFQSNRFEPNSRLAAKVCFRWLYHIKHFSVLPISLEYFGVLSR